MKRFHVHVGVANLDQSIAFYSSLFGTEPTTTKADYAKWILEDPRVNFAISSKAGVNLGVEHLGIQAENADELSDIYAKLQASGRPVLNEGEAQCCYAQSSKNWVTDPDGVIWEAFHSHGELTSYGEKLDINAIQAHAEKRGAPYCAPKTELPASAPGCG
jgi:catechol 2,3-dioxygenase-like lactoylglutathione lyase family enzyme